MDSLTRIQSTEFKQTLLEMLQDNTLIKKMPIDCKIREVDRRLIYLSLRCKLVQDINAKNITSEKRLLHDMAVLYIIAKKTDKGFDKKYSALVKALASYVEKVDRDLLR